MLDAFYAAEMRYIAQGGARGGASFSEMAACFHPHAVMHQGPSVPFPGDWEGIDEIERFFGVLSDTWAAAEGLDVTYFVGDDGVAVSMRVELTSRATGTTVDGRLGQFILFEDGLIPDFTVYYLDPVLIGRAAVCDRSEPLGPVAHGCPTVPSRSAERNFAGAYRTCGRPYDERFTWSSPPRRTKEMEAVL